MTTTAQNVIRLEIDGRSLEAPECTTLGQLFSESYPEGYKQGIAARLNGKIVDFHTPVRKPGRLELLPLDSPEGLRIVPPSTAHLVTTAVLHVVPDRQLAT